MPANSCAAIRPARTPRRMRSGATHRKGESCRRIHSPLFARTDATTCVLRRDNVRANHAGEFIRRYSPVRTPRRMYSGATQRKGESCRRIHSPLFALQGRHDVCAPARHNVRANHPGEFIRRYSPFSRKCVCFWGRPLRPLCEIKSTAAVSQSCWGSARAPVIAARHDSP